MVVEWGVIQRTLRLKILKSVLTPMNLQNFQKRQALGVLILLKVSK